MNYLNINQYKCTACGGTIPDKNGKCDTCSRDNWTHPEKLTLGCDIKGFKEDAKSLGYDLPMELLECWHPEVVKVYKRFLERMSWSDINAMTREEYEMFLGQFREGGVTPIDETLARAIALINALDGEQQRNADDPVLKYVDLDKL